ncbi:SseB family protein [Aquimarina longa]|uniref:SseB family protein n=1 Tax=Aquimarina longa TaxID=1080221 RepID=UPI0007812ABF|nr:SseB family protein [Aquimarina longa]
MKKYLSLILTIILLSNCDNKKEINKKEIKNIFNSTVYVLVSIGESNNKFHPNLHMFRDDKNIPFFPIYTSREKILETEIVMPDSFPANGTILALMSSDEMTYKINYSLNDEIIIKGKELKKILSKEIEEFKKNNKDILEGVILNN